MVSRSIVIILLLGLLVGLAPAAAQPPEVDPRRTVVFAVDASTSIQGAEYELQLRAIQVALSDEQDLRGDDQVAVVSFANDETFVDLPLQTLADPSAREAAVAIVDDIAQRGGNTNAGGGVERAARLASFGPEDHETTVCLMTDGVTNVGVDLSSAVATARDEGLDRLSVLAIARDEEDSEPLAAEYADAVFGSDEGFAVAPGVPEATQMIAGTCLNDGVVVRAIEVTQAVQTWRNDVSLWQGKPTAVRVHMHLPDGQTDPERVTPQLRGFRDGAELPSSPLLPFGPDAAGVEVTDLLAEDGRGTLDGSAEFVLPESWTDEPGQIELIVDGGGTPLDCRDPAPPNDDDCQATVDLRDGPRPNVHVLGVTLNRVAEDGSTTTTRPTVAAIRETADRLATALPSARPDFTFSRLEVTARGSQGGSIIGPVVSATIRSVMQRRALDGCNPTTCDDVYVAQLSGDPERGVRGYGPPGLRTAVVRDGDLTFPTSQTTPGLASRRQVVIHEVGHVLGRPHPVPVGADTEPAGRPGPLDDFRVGTCGERAGQTQGTFPNYSIHPSFGMVASISPEVGDDDQVFGLDTRFLASARSMAVQEPFGPGASVEVMSYCRTASRQGSWPSDATYEAIGTAVVAQFSGVVPRGATTIIEGPALAFTGVFDEGGFDLSTPVRVEDTPEAAHGPYDLVLLDGEEQEVARASFEAEPHQVDAAEGPSQSFLVAIPEPETAFAQVQVEIDGETLHTQTVDGAAPDVSIDGLEVDAGALAVTFTTSDDALAAIRTSADDGASWTTHAVGHQGPAATVDPGQTPGGEVLVEVQASTGGLVASDRGRITVPDSPPTVSITHPSSGGVPLIAGSDALVTARASDPEDGDLSDEVVWTATSTTGQATELFTGASGVIEPAALREGTYVLTAEVTDSAGQTASSAVAAFVELGVPPGVVEPPVRLAADDRIGTAIRVSQSTFADAAGGPGAPAGGVVLTRADAFPDALAGTPLAGRLRAPMLLTGTASLDDRVLAEIARVLPPGGLVHLLGGPAALSDDVEQALADAGFGTVRYAGAGRFETAVAIATEGLGSPDRVLLATANDFPDALAGGVAAGRIGAAILLTAGDEPAAATQAYLEDVEVEAAWALGGPAARAHPDARPIVGSSRFETSVLIAEEFAPVPEAIGVATGRGFADALAGGAQALVRRGVLVLTEPTFLPEDVAAFIAHPLRRGADGFLYGGPAAISEDVLEAVADR